VALQPTDPKEDPWVGRTSRFDLLPEVPILILSGEQETDTRYPLAERVFERVRGAGTMVTIYGGCHGFTADTGQAACKSCEYLQEDASVDDCPYIARPLQQRLTRRFLTAFLRRYAFGDLSFEGALYGDEYQRSPLVSVASRRNLGGALLVDDFARFPRNALGRPTGWSGEELAVAVGSTYDLPELSPPAPFPPIDNLVLSLPVAGEVSYRSSLGEVSAPLDVGPRKRLLVRAHNPDRRRRVDNAGFGWLDLSVALEDADGDVATVSLNDRLPTTRFHPDPHPAGSEALLKYQRWITASVLLEEFTSQNPGLNLDSLVELEWRCATFGSAAAAPRLGIDDIRFE
jgi:hypothetical protein